MPVEQAIIEIEGKGMMQNELNLTFMGFGTIVRTVILTIEIIFLCDKYISDSDSSYTHYLIMTQTIAQYSTARNFFAVFFSPGRPFLKRVQS